MRGESRIIARLLRNAVSEPTFRIMVAALSIAVAAVTAVGFFVDRFDRAMVLRGAELLGADLVVKAHHPLPDDWGAQAEEDGIAVSGYVQFPSVVVTPSGGTQLVAVKAVDAGYPLRGELKISAQASTEGSVVDDRPPPDGAWLDPRLGPLLDIKTAIH